MKKLYYIIGALLGEVLIILVLLEFYPYFGQRIFVQNLIFLTLAYVLVLTPLFLPLADLKDKEQKWVAGLGAKMSGTVIYMVCTVLAMIACNINMPPVPAKYQLYIYLFLLLLLILFLAVGSKSEEKVGEVYRKEQKREAGLKIIRQEMATIVMKTNLMERIPQQVKNDIISIDESLRFITPIDTEEAEVLEQSILKEIRELDFLKNNYETNKKEVHQALLLINELLERRKKCFF